MVIAIVIAVVVILLVVIYISIRNGMKGPSGVVVSDQAGLARRVAHVVRRSGGQGGPGGHQYGGQPRPQGGQPQGGPPPQAYQPTQQSQDDQARYQQDRAAYELVWQQCCDRHLPTVQP